ncbi:MAG: hypothetical protein ACOYN5_04475 [Bacteroidales bacterium]
MPDEFEKIIESTPGRRLSSDKFYNDAAYRNLRAMRTQKEDVGLGNVENYGIATKTEAEAGSVENKYMNPLRTLQAIVADQKNSLFASVNLVPVAAKAEVAFGEETFTITAVDNTIAGEGITISFVDPEDVSQALAVSVTLGVIIVSHATDEAGAINTTAAALETAINNHAEVKLIVHATKSGVGTVDHTGDVVTAGYESAIVCEAGKIFSDGSFLYLALNDVDGLTNESTDFKKVALNAI